MLNEFLVLGQVPGTNFQITFTEMLLAAYACLAVYLFIKRQIVIKTFRYICIYIHFYILVKKTRYLRLPA